MGKTGRLNIRVTEEQHDLLRRAALSSGQTISDYVLSHVLADAYDDLADQRLFSLNAPQWAEFVARVDRPVAHKPALAELLASTPPWDAGSEAQEEQRSTAAERDEFSNVKLEPLLSRIEAALKNADTDWAEVVSAAVVRAQENARSLSVEFSDNVEAELLLSRCIVGALKHADADWADAFDADLARAQEDVRSHFSVIVVRPSQPSKGDSVGEGPNDEVLTQGHAGVATEGVDRDAPTGFLSFVGRLALPTSPSEISADSGQEPVRGGKR